MAAKAVNEKGSSPAKRLMSIGIDRANAFAREWIEAWNTRDLPRILSHYTDDFEMRSPFIARVTGEPSGTLVGKSQVEAYWLAALQKLPHLHFELQSVLGGTDSIVVFYKTSFGQTAAEVLFINQAGKVYRGVAHYADTHEPRQTRVFDHIDLRVRNLAQAKSFYDQLMPALGFPNACETSLGIAYEAASDHPKPEFVGLIEDPDHRPSATRIAFWAASKQEVDRIAERLTLAGARNREGPMLCPEYSPTYYAVFFDDPSGNHLEVCCRMETQRTGFL